MNKFLCILFIAGSANAASLYVDKSHPSASDSNDGSESLPWLTIGKAASTAVAGDSVTVKAGTYNEYVTMGQSGSDGNLITFTGERGVGGEWLTIIDPSTDLSAGWVSAPEIGTGVYKQTVAFVTRELTIAGKRVAFVYDNGTITTQINETYTGSGLTTGAQLLAIATDATVVLKMSGATVEFWDGIEAMWGASGTTTYLRLRDGSDPNGLAVRAAANDDTAYTTDMDKPAVKFNGRSYVVFRNFKVQGAFGCLLALSSTTHHLTIEDNYLANGYARILVGTGAHDNTIQDNEMTVNYYGYADPGAWGSGAGATAETREHLYLFSKHIMGVSVTFDNDIKFDQAGAANVISGNHIFDSLGTGISIAGSVETPTQDTIILTNVIEGHTSIGISLSAGQTGTEVRGNLISDCNINMRLPSLDTSSETSRVCYIYRNLFWLPANVGNQIYAHFNSDNGTTYNPEFWFYHNSFSGGDRSFTVSSFAYYNNGLPGFRFLNNIISGCRYINYGEIPDGFLTEADMVGLFDYNMVTPTYPASTPAWFGANNIELGGNVWDTGSVPSFALSGGSPALDTGVDIPSVYPALPMSGTRIGAGWDIGALEFSTNPPKKPRRNGPGRFRGM